RHTRLVSDWSSDVCSSDLGAGAPVNARDVPPRMLDNVRGTPRPLARGGAALRTHLKSFQPWLETDGVTEISVNRAREIWIARQEIGRASWRGRVRSRAGRR